MEGRSQLAERIVDQVADAVIYANRAGVITRWNRASAALFGFSAQDALGQSLDLIIPEHLRAAHWRGFEAAVATGAMKLEGRPTLTRALHKSGRKLYVEMTFAIVKGEAEGEVLGSVAMARDVTERVERERAATRAA
jgi:PAS domain S-box-containing protein